MQEFAEFYNEEHKHSQIRFVTPGQRRGGDDKKILLQRHGVYQKAMKENPGRCPVRKHATGKPWDVTLNPVKNKEMNQPVNQTE